MTVLPPAGEIPTGGKDEFRSALADGIAKLDQADADAEAAEAAENQPQSLSDMLANLSAIVNEPEEPVPPAKPGEKPAEPEVPPSKKELEALMEKLADEPDSVRQAVRRALESGMDAKEAVDAILTERNNIIAHSQLVKEVDELSKAYPSFTPEQLQTTLDHLSKLPAHLADALSLEEVAVRAIGRDALNAAKEQPKPPAPKPGTPPASRPGSRLLAEAKVIGDATPGAPMDGKPFDAGRGNSFNDLASFIVQKHGSDLMLPTKK